MPVNTGTSEDLAENRTFTLQPHLLQYSFSKEYNEKEFNYILDQSFVHKLNYKYDRALLSQKGCNNLQRILETNTNGC